MAVTLAKSQQEIQSMPLVDLACEILKARKEPYYFRDLMHEVQELRGMSSDDAVSVIARLYTEINMDGRFVCVGQNVWGLKRWYPIDKAVEKPSASKRFVRRSADAFSDDDDLESDYDDDSEDDSVDDEEELLPLDVVSSGVDDDDDDEEANLTPDEDESADYDADEEDEVTDDEEAEVVDEEDTSDDQDEEY